MTSRGHAPLPPAEVEALLRDAFAERAGHITVDTLVRGYAAPSAQPDARPDTDRSAARHLDPRDPRERRAGWLIPAAAAVVVVGAVVGASVLSRGGQPQPPIPGVTTVATSGPSASITSPTPVTSPSVPTQAVTPREVAAAQISWPSVGAGWAVAALDPDSQGQSATIYLLAPDGARSPVATLSGSPRIVAVTADARRALVLTQPSGQPQRLHELDLQSGTTRAIMSPPVGTEITAGYADGQGSSVLVARYAGSGTETQTTVERWRPDGTRVGDVLALPGRAIVLPSADGARLLIGTQGGLAFYGADGALVAAVDRPGGMTWCQPVRWFDATRALVDCRAAEGDVYAVQFTVDPTGATERVTPTVSQPTGASPDEIGSVAGQWQAWARADGTLLTTLGSGCQQGTYAAGLPPAAGTSAIGRVTGAASDTHAMVVAVVGGTAYATVGCFESTHGVALLDIATMTPTAILGIPVQSRGDVVGLRVAQPAPAAIGFPTYR